MENTEENSLLLSLFTNDFKSVEDIESFYRKNFNPITFNKLDVYREKSTLVYASENGNINLVKFLLNKGVGVTARALHAAARKHLECLKCLVERCGFSVNNAVVDSFGATCLMSACRYSNYDTAKYLIENSSVNQQNNSGDAAIHFCTDLNIMKLLVENGANVRLPGRNGDTPLIRASFSPNTQSFKYLLSLDTFTLKEKAEALEMCGVSFIDKHFLLSFAFDVWKKAYEMNNNLLLPPTEEEIIVTKYFKISPFITQNLFNDDQDEMWKRCMFITEKVLGRNHPKTIRLAIKLLFENLGCNGYCLNLLEYTFELLIQQDHKFTWPILNSFEEFIYCATQSPEFLLDNFDRIMNLFELAINKVAEQTVDFIDIIYNISYDLCSVDFVLDSHQIKRLLKKVLKYRCLCDGSSLLHFACSKKNSCRFISKLLELGANPNYRDNFGNTPLHRAAKHSSDVSVINLLLENSAHPDVKNFNGETPCLPTRSFQLVTPLFCLASTIVKEHSLDFNNYVPKHWHEFVNMH